MPCKHGSIYAIKNVLAKRLKSDRNFDDGVNVGDVYNGLRLRSDWLRIRIIHSEWCSIKG
ncbi:hypothetical protein H6G96_05950 [Nostoc sp. FACHB-892]|uniref:hypothetical protein n=1 Tax=Nostoc sp. FACHB-892 TaxID=2692843 RepID=UPI00168A36F3|nr:hypothetical protein [Nostoc sp. FACHB-892]MBD2725875.1 hypothetical protein [Nostoc sp. FACHB-892]